MSTEERQEVSEPPIGASLPPEPDDAPRARRVYKVLWLVLPLIALAELVGHGVIVARVPSESDWERASAHVREALTDGDRVLAAPHWADPIVRQQLGDIMSMRMAAPSDNAPFDRLFELSIRGHRAVSAPERDPDETTRFGRVTVNRWDLGPSTVRYDFVDSIRGAVVERVRNGNPEPCRWSRRPARGRTGLAQGHTIPEQRFICDPAGGAMWVGTTVMEDLDYQPHFCIYQHPQGLEPIRTTFRNVPLGDRIVLYGGLYNRHEREGIGAPIHARVLVDGETVGEFVHRDLDGWSSIVLETRDAERVAASPEEMGNVTVEVWTPNPGYRSFCWTATTRSGTREGEH